MRAMKVYDGLKAYLHSSLSLALDGGEWSTVLPATLLPRRTPQVTIELEAVLAPEPVCTIRGREQ